MWCLKLKQVYTQFLRKNSVFCEVVSYSCKNIYIDIMYIPKVLLSTAGNFQAVVT